MYGKIYILIVCSIYIYVYIILKLQWVSTNVQRLHKDHTITIIIYSAKETLFYATGQGGWIKPKGYNEKRTAIYVNCVSYLTWRRRLIVWKWKDSALSNSVRTVKFQTRKGLYIVWSALKLSKSESSVMCKTGNGR